MVELGEAVVMVAIVGFTFGLLYVIAKLLVNTVDTDDNQD